MAVRKRRASSAPDGLRKQVHPTRAVVAHELNKFTVENISIDPPKVGEVLVRMCATGVCHSDVPMINGTLPLPTVSGHAGSGVAEQVGKGLTDVKPGDHSVLSFVPSCGSCFHCLRGEPHLACGTNVTSVGCVVGPAHVANGGWPCGAAGCSQHAPAKALEGMAPGVVVLSEAGRGCGG